MELWVLPWVGVSRGCVSGRKKVDGEAFLHQRGSCQKASCSPRPSVYCLSQSIFCYIMHQADPYPTDSAPEAFLGLSPWACDWAAGLTGPPASPSSVPRGGRAQQSC